eukprot:929199-Rhodomonas_salina.1
MGSPVVVYPEVTGTGLDQTALCEEDRCPGHNSTGTRCAILLLIRWHRYWHCQKSAEEFGPIKICRIFKSSVLGIPSRNSERAVGSGPF